MGWKDTPCPELRYNPQHPQGSSRPSGTPVPVLGDLTLSSGLCSQGEHRVSAQTYEQAELPNTSSTSKQLFKTPKDSNANTWFRYDVGQPDAPHYKVSLYQHSLCKCPSLTQSNSRPSATLPQLPRLLRQHSCFEDHCWWLHK